MLISMEGGLTRPSIYAFSIVPVVSTGISVLGFPFARKPNPRVPFVSTAAVLVLHRARGALGRLERRMKCSLSPAPTAGIEIPPIADDG